MKIQNLLPIGSVVLLKNGEKKLMITGILQNDAGGTKKNYDYLGVLYPEGHIGEDYQYLFNHEDIKEIFFRGYEDAERNKFIKRLSKEFEN
ncbi:MAG: DUF4176 domain-containing protein [Erysipelotrichaceae bacterium]|nr:DUF4176 domain-containing protein [Erysipelotrichaceae bacterium]